ncbi:hypothetical protein CEXT_362801, partial [Caerostris extrusa]
MCRMDSFHKASTDEDSILTRRVPDIQSNLKKILMSIEEEETKNLCVGECSRSSRLDSQS